MRFDRSAVLSRGRGFRRREAWAWVQGWRPLLALLPALLGFRLVPPLAAARPNVVFLLSDDQRADTLHRLGNRYVRTPHLDALAARGTAFTEAHIMGALQGAVCMPSRAMLLGGRTLFRTPENLQGLTPWPRRLGDAGYQTFITGKWHNGREALPRTFTRGEAIFLGGMTDQNKVAVSDLDPEAGIVRSRTEARFTAELFGDSAVAFLRQQTAATPFCLYVAFTTPHDPRTSPAAFRQGYDPARLPLPANFLPQHPFDNGELQVRDELLLPSPRPPAEVRQAWADYYASISATDAQVGRILGELNRSGLAQNTIVVFAGDNGLALGSHGLLGKQNLYEHSTRVPLLIAGPGIARNRRTSALCYLLDLPVTLTELTGVPAPDAHEGRSLVPLLRPGRPPAAHREVLFTAYRDLQRAVRDSRWKWIEYPKADRVQLFDLQRDPGERNDLSTEPRYVAERTRLAARLRTEAQAAGDPWVTGVPAPGAKKP